MTSRRRLLLGGAALAAQTFLGPIGSRRARAADEPKIFLDYTQAELDRAYDQRSYAPDMDAIIARWAAKSALARQRFKALSFRYGDGPYEDLEVFPAAVSNAPIHAFVHGGEWRRAGNEGGGYPAAILVPAGVTYVNLNFAAIPQVRIPDMVDQLRRAIVWIHTNAAARFGGDPQRITLSGHSSGGHLAAVLLTTDWPAHGAPDTVLKAGTCISGLYEMQPVLLSQRRSFVKLSEDEAIALSPIRHLDRLRCPVTIAIGGRETPEFRRQGSAMAALLRGGRFATALLDLPGLNHFEMPETLADGQSPLAQAVLKQITA